MGQILRGYVLYSQTIVPNKRHQIEREVAWKEWKGHTPSWFYWTIELFQKEDYRDKDRRNILQFIPILLAVRQNEKSTQEEQEDVDLWAKQQAFKWADYEIDVAYLFIKKDLLILRGALEKHLQQARKAGAYLEMITEITNDRDRIEGRIYTIHESKIPNADRREEYFIEIKKYKQLIILTQRLIKAFEMIKKP